MCLEKTLHSGKFDLNFIYCRFCTTFILKLLACSYLQRDVEDMAEFVRNCPSEFKEYYIQMQVAKRSQAPNRTQVNTLCIYYMPFYT